MNLNLSHYQTAAFNSLLKTIVQQAAPEKIFLLSACMQQHRPRSIFCSLPAEVAQATHYHLLVIAAENEPRSNNLLQQTIEQAGGAEGLVTAYVLPIHQFNKWLMHAHPFACKVYTAGTLCYDAGRVPLAIPNTVDDGAVRQLLRHEFTRSLHLAAGFLAAAELFTLRHQFALAAFNLHQCAEQVYTGIIRVHTGLRVQTHNLHKLYRYSLHLLAGLQAILPRNSPAEKHLFTLLQKAYTESRYATQYSIKRHEINLLTRRMHNLLQLCQPVQTLTPITI